MPLAADAAFLRRRWSGFPALRGRDGSGRLVAAGAVRPSAGGVTFCGLVDPGARGQGAGSHLLGWGLAEAAARGRQVTVETESLTATAEALFAARGLARVFAEDVM